MMNWDLVDEMINAGYIKVTEHPSLPLVIHNYTHLAQFDKVWNEATLNCRGLISTKDHKTIVARPFSKFFNFGEVESPNEPFEVFEKMDGSLFIASCWEGNWITATRGSFTSEQAEFGRQYLRNTCGYENMSHEYTYLFEVIYPENRIVIDYSDADVDHLTLLAAIHTESGKEDQYDSLGAHQLPFKIVKKYPHLEDKSPSKLRDLEEENREGFVLKYASGQRIKIKFDWYVRMHKILTGLSVKGVWEHLSSGSTISSLVKREDVPDEFHCWLQNVALDLYDRRQGIITQAKLAMEKCPKDDATRKEQAAYIKDNVTIPAIGFAMLDGRDYDKIVWKNLKPTHHETFSMC